MYYYPVTEDTTYLQDFVLRTKWHLAHCNYKIDTRLIRSGFKTQHGHSQRTTLAMSLKTLILLLKSI